jgi:hypothetical protein
MSFHPLIEGLHFYSFNYKLVMRLFIREQDGYGMGKLLNLLQRVQSYGW